MRIFKNKWLAKFAEKQSISDADLIEAVQRANSGLIDADLGGNVIKQRIARKGQGKSGGFRSLIFFKQGDKAFCMMAFAKSDRENINAAELTELKKAAAVMLAMTNKDIEAAKSNETLTEIQP